MKLRRFISMMLIVTMLTVFAGCGNKDDRTQAAKKLNLSGPITVLSLIHISEPTRP